MTEGLQLSIPQRMMLVRITLVCALVASVLLSLPLWCGERTFPYAPLVDQAITGPPYDTALVVFMLLCLVASMFLTFQRTLIFLAVLTGIVLISADVNRLQPWFYIYSAMLAVYVFYNGRVDDPNRYTSFFIILQIIFASVYFFNGLNQLNCLFIDSDYTALIAPLKKLVSERQFLFFKKMGFFVPYILMFTGLGLIISAIRYLAITLAILIHLLLLVFLFPTGNNDYALWLSNLSFMIMLLFLFSGKTKQRYFSPTFLLQRPLFYVVMGLFVIMPFFNNSGRWPDFLSANFKSGNNQTAVFKISKKAYESLPLYERYYCVPADSVFILDYKKWCRHELKSECFPDRLVFNSILEDLKKQADGNVKETELIITPKLALLCKQ